MKVKCCNGMLLAGIVLATALCMAPTIQVEAQNIGNQSSAQSTHVVKGTVTDDMGEPLTGAIVRVKNGSKAASVDMDGNFTLSGIPANAVLVVTYVGFLPQEVAVNRRATIAVKLKEDNKTMNEVVVTAMGILRKEKSLTYATQKVKSEDLMRVQDPNVANSLEGKIAGITITPSAGGAGGASKIMLRGNKSILGNSEPLIVVDGIPINNETRGRINSAENIAYQGLAEGNDPLSMINPDDIESINVLKGANAAALYGTRAANGVLMITTKKGREGKLDVTYTGNVTFDTPLMTPDIQGVYGAPINPTTSTVGVNGWGDKVANASNYAPTGVFDVTNDNTYFRATGPDATNHVRLRSYNNDDVSDFYRTGVTTNNSISLSGGTETVKNYFSIANSHAVGMLQENNYNRNTAALRQTYVLFKKRLTVDVNLNYVQTKTKNRTGGGTVMNPIYHLYMTPRNIDMGYYRNNYVVQNGEWHSDPNAQIYQLNALGSYDRVPYSVDLTGPRQEWAYLQKGYNNPYWLMKQNSGIDKDDRIYGSASAKVDIWDGLSFQARFNFDNSRFNSESKRYATTFVPASMEYVGRYWKTINKAEDYYTDFLLNYNKTIKKDWALSATGGWVGHSRGTENQQTGLNATYVDGWKNGISDIVNMFMTNAGDAGVTSTSYGNNWDWSVLGTAQLGWKDKVFVDGSYRRDWYRAFRQYTQRGNSPSFGYFGVGANAIISELVTLPKWWSYFKYRLSYSEVGNSYPDGLMTIFKVTRTGAIKPNENGAYRDPKPETVGSLETGLDMQFLDDRLSVDITFYNLLGKNQFMRGNNQSGKSILLNTGKIRNRGFETTVGYNFHFGKDWRWKTQVNYSFNNNKILETAHNADGSEFLIYTDVAGVRVRYSEGGSIGDMYITDFKRNADGTLVLNSKGKPMLETAADKTYGVKIGNMNSKSQLGWSNTISYKDFQLFFLINGRVGGKVISLTEAYLDESGFSQRTADARMAAELNGWTMPDGRAAMPLPDGSGRMIAVEDWYTTVGARGKQYSPNYVYNATNFRLRELSLSYMFRNLLGNGKNLSLSFIARNLFFLYKDAPVDPDISLSTGTGLGGFEMFNLPSSRSYGINVKLNF
ncbi:MAG: SusC/RagA family TonB-linked outer membrane protein [Bacteroidaceae bacterium]|nr:SusC/RagA family TonB-linked outer membrane protein [Bacteroidaceae bacterium]